MASRAEFAFLDLVERHIKGEVSSAEFHRRVDTLQQIADQEMTQIFPNAAANVLGHGLQQSSGLAGTPYGPMLGQVIHHPTERDAFQQLVRDWPYKLQSLAHSAANDRMSTMQEVSRILKEMAEHHKALIEVMEWFEAQSLLDIFKHDPRANQYFHRIVAYGVQAMLTDIVDKKAPLPFVVNVGNP